jgi:enamine deaminase RidA (YjgF/YER057c/UK114 family)
MIFIETSVLESTYLRNNRPLPRLQPASDMTTCAKHPLTPASVHGSLWLRAIPHATWTEYLLGANPATHANPSHWAADLENFLVETGASLVELDAFGDTGLVTRLRLALAKWLPPGFPLSIMVNSGNHGPLAGGLLARAVLGVPVTPVSHGRSQLGFRFEDAHTAYCYLGGLVPINTTDGDGSAQTLEVIGSIKTCLESVGMTFRDVARTWYYLDGILSWYDGFNRTRTDFFNEHDVFSRLMPASTGIGIANDTGLLPLAKVHACRAKSADFRVAVADSPLQGSAYDYGSAFSRAVTLASPSGTTLHVSGTASIAPTGETEHLGDVQSQLARTMEVVEAILRAAGMDWSHAVRGIAYFHNAADLHLWEPARIAWNLPDHMAVAVHADICRDDLLFELELEAFRP